MFAALFARLWACEDRQERQAQTIADLLVLVSRLESELRDFRSKF